MDVSDYIRTHAGEIAAIASAIHQNPELSLQEHETTALIRSKLCDWGVPICQAALDTGLIAVIHGGLAGPAIALRADMDALPVTEQAGHVPCSQREGVMHACGHDVHTAALLGAAAALQQCRDTLHGDAVLIFQPAEELAKGAPMVLSTGILQRLGVKAVFALHVMPDIAAGKVGLRSGPAMAAQECFTIRITGTGSHGATPHFSRDPIIAATAVVNALQTLSSRLVDPVEPFVLSICSMHAGATFNIIPDVVELGGTMRFANDALRKPLKDQLDRIVTAVAAANGCHGEVEYFYTLEPVINDVGLYAIAQDSARAVFGPDNILWPEFRMVSEDFGLYAQQAPTFMYFVGCGEESPAAPLHSPAFCAAKGTLCLCAQLMAQTAVQALSGAVLA